MSEDILQNDILDLMVSEFLKAMDNVAIIFENLGGKVTLNDNFSKLLMHVQPGFIQHFKSCQILASQKLFFSLGTICRSLFDLEITLAWICKLDTDQKNKAIQTYLDFNGTDPETKESIRDWQKIIDKKFSYRKIALDLKIDIPMSIIDEDEKMSTFDFLSKILHWNPLTLKALTGRNEQGIVTYKPGALIIITLHTALKSICGFTLFYVLNFFPEKRDIFDNLTNIRREFQKQIAQYLDLKV